jgi:hypothetical protein
MARQKAILKPCGFEVAQRRRRCSQNTTHPIEAGEQCLTFNEQMRRKSYCLICAAAIIEKGRLQIEVLLKQLSSLAHS